MRGHRRYEYEAWQHTPKNNFGILSRKSKTKIFPLINFYALGNFIYLTKNSLTYLKVSSGAEALKKIGLWIMAYGPKPGVAGRGVAVAVECGIVKPKFSPSI